MPGLHLAAVSGAAIVALGLAGACGAAETGGEPKSELVALYTLSVAIDTCGDLDIANADEDKLDKAMSALEAKLALTEEASEALYAQIAAAADNDRDGFCKDAGATVKTAIAKLPQ